MNINLRCSFSKTDHTVIALCVKLLAPDSGLRLLPKRTFESKNIAGQGLRKTANCRAPLLALSFPQTAPYGSFKFIWPKSLIKALKHLVAHNIAK